MTTALNLWSCCWSPRTCSDKVLNRWAVRESAGISSRSTAAATGNWGESAWWLVAQEWDVASARCVDGREMTCECVRPRRCDAASCTGKEKRDESCNTCTRYVLCESEAATRTDHVVPRRDDQLLFVVTNRLLALVFLLLNTSNACSHPRRDYTYRYTLLLEFKKRYLQMLNEALLLGKLIA